MDILIGDTDYLGKGYSTPIIQQFIHEIILPMKPSKIIVDSEIENKKALQAYEKAGFTKTQLISTTNGLDIVPGQLMEMKI